MPDDDPNVQIFDRRMPECMEPTSELFYWIFGGYHEWIRCDLEESCRPFHYVQHPDFLWDTNDEECYPMVFEETVFIEPNDRIMVRCSHCDRGKFDPENQERTQIRFSVCAETPELPRVSFVNHRKYELWQFFVADHVKQHIEKRGFKTPVFDSDNLNEKVLPSGDDPFPPLEQFYPTGEFWRVTCRAEADPLYKEFIPNTEADTKCKNCGGETNCPLCGARLFKCRYCQTEFRYGGKVFPEGADNVYTFEAKNWNGDDLIESGYILIVTGEVLESFLNAGFSGFAYGECVTDLSGASPEIRKQVEKKSRKIREFPNCRFFPKLDHK